MKEKVNMKKIGKQNRASGLRFESSVRKDLEDKGWIVSKWMNNVQFKDVINKKDDGEIFIDKLIPAKHKFCGIGRPMAIGTGFPDFVVFKPDVEVYDKIAEKPEIKYTLMGVEAKSNGYLDKAEKEKCKWLLDNNIFSKILIASKGEKRGSINYKEFNNEKEN